MNKSLQLSSLLPLVCLDSCNLPLRTRVTTNDLGEWPHARYLSHFPFPKFYSSDTQTSKGKRIQITLSTSCKYEVRINTVERSLSFCCSLGRGMALAGIGDVIIRAINRKERRLLCSGAPKPPLGQKFLIIEISRSHSDTPHSVGLLW